MDSPKKFIIWNERYSVHHEEIDTQHAELVNLINLLYDSVQIGNKENNSLLIVKLQEYARLHLQTETEIMTSVNYPNIKEHMEHHNKLIIALDRLSSQHKLYDNNMIREVLSVIKEWWLKHEASFDREYIDYIDKDNE